MSAPRPAHYWPSATQTELLRAALLDGDHALAAWTRWKVHADLDRLDSGSQRLLPLVAHNLKRSGVDDPALRPSEGFVRHTLIVNQRRMAQISVLIRALNAAAIPVMLLKGMALVRRHYPHMGLRPMGDIDLLVPTADISRAMHVVREAGWRSHGPEVDVSVGHSRSFVGNENACLDLHWHALWEACGPTSDDEFWSSAEPEKVTGATVWIPCPADLFLQVVVHGVRWNDVPPVRWVADAMTILSTAGQTFEWTRLVAQARSHALVLPIRQALLYLGATFKVSVPPEVLEELETYRASAFERIEQRAREWTSPRVGCFPLVLCHHVRLTRAAGPVAVVAGLPRYLQHTYGLPRLRELPAALYSRAISRARASSRQPS